MHREVAPELRSPAGRRLAVTILSAGLLLALAPAGGSSQASPLHLQATPAATSPWLDRLNQWRTSTGVSTLTENSTWSAGDYSHSLYMVKNDLVTHYETPGTPYYTVDGDAAARNGNIQVNSTTATTDPQAIDWWMAAPFHAMAMMDPRLTQTGFGSYREVKSGWQEGGTLDTIRGNSFTGGQYPVYFPGRNTNEPLATYTGGEFPNPLQACPGYAAPTGLPVFIEIGGNVNTTVSAHSFSANGVALNHCVIDSSASAVSSYLYTRGAVILVPQLPLQTGVTYSVSLTVNGTPYSWSFTVGNFSACTAVTESVTPAPPQLAGASVKFTANATGCPHPQYQFWVLPPGSHTWQIVQPFSTSNTFTWNTSGLAAGSYLYTVWARDTGSPGACSYLGCTDAFYPGTPYDLGTPPCTAVTDVPSPAPPQASGSTITFTASATGCANPRYQFWILPPGGSWKIVQPYSTSSTFTWTTSGLAPGNYLYTAWARDAGSGGAQCSSLGCNDAFFAALGFNLTRQACTSVSDTPSPAPPQVASTSITFTATSTGCPHPLYQFWILAPGGTWQVVQAYSASTTFTWSTLGLPAGNYLYTAWARDTSSTGTQCSFLGCNDAYFAALTFTLAGQPCASVTDTPSPASPQHSGTSITFTATSTGCAHPLYQFWVRPPGGSWQVVRAYSSSNTFTWNTNGLPAGTYLYTAWARDTSSSGTQCSSLGCDDAYFVAVGYALN